MTRIYGRKGEAALYVSGPDDKGRWRVENGGWMLVPLANGKYCAANYPDQEFDLDLLMEPAPDVPGCYNAVLAEAQSRLAQSLLQG